MSALDLDIGEVFKRLFSRGAGSGAKSKPGVPVSAVQSHGRMKGPVLLVLMVMAMGAFVYLYFLPLNQQVQDMRSKVEQLPQLNREISDLGVAFDRSQVRLSEARQRYLELTRLFHTERELEDLYRHISTIALTNGLTITGINKQKEMPVYEGAADQAKGVQVGTTGGAEVAYYIVPMRVNFSGPYLNYIRFRAGLADIPKLVNIDSESIRVVDTKEGKTEVNINAVISTYRMPERYMNLKIEK